MALLDSLRTQTPNLNPSANQLSASVPACSQCGKIHPPLKAGETCPLANPKDDKGKEINTDKFIITLKNIILSQAQKKGIKDMNKLLSRIIVEVTKYIENYKE